MGLRVDDDRLRDVLTVEVAGAGPTGSGTAITGYAAGPPAVLDVRRPRYVDRAVGDVVSDLLGEGQVDEGDVDAR